MKTITKTYNIYEFDELNEKVKENLISEEIKYQQEHYCEIFLEEDMRNFAIELLQKYFGEKAKFNGVYYSLSYCQGDGAMIEFDLNYYNKELEIKHDNSHYYHENSFNIIEKDNPLTELQYKRLKEKIRSINKELERYGYDEIERDFRDEAIEALKENEYLEDGELYI